MDEIMGLKFQLGFVISNSIFFLPSPGLKRALARILMVKSASAPYGLYICSWNFDFRCQIPLRGKSFGKVLEWHVVVKGFGLAC